MIVKVQHFGVATSVGDVLPGAAVDLPDAEARRLITRGRAVLVTADTEPVEPPPAPHDPGDGPTPVPTATDVVVPVVDGRAAKRRNR